MMFNGFFTQWSTSTFPTVYDVENNENGTMTEAQIIGQRHWKITESAAGLQAKFGHMS